MHIGLAFIISFLVTFLFIRQVTPLAKRIGLVDHPNHRKHHKTAIPLIGGLAMFAGINTGFLFLDISLSSYRGLIVGMIILVFIGLLDDFHEIKPKARLIAQIITGLVMTIWAGNSLQSFGDLFSTHPFYLYGFGVPITIFALVCIVNAVNMLDGADGLLGSIAIVQLSSLLLLALLVSRNTDALVIGIVIVSIVAFLLFNFPFTKTRTASVFMGDTGSLLLGFILFWFCVSLSQGENPASPVIMLWVMILPIFNFCGVIALRLSQRKPLMQADRQHLHHLLQLQGVTDKKLVFLMVFFIAIVFLIAIVLLKTGFSQLFLFSGYIFLFFIYMLYIFRLQKKKQI